MAECPYDIASSISSSVISSNSPSTIAIELSLAPIIISISDASNCFLLGLITNMPSTLPTRTSDMGYSNGISES